MATRPSPPTEETLAGTVDGTNHIYRNMEQVTSLIEVGPIFILYEESHLWTNESEEAHHITRRIEWQIANDVSSRIILTHLIARGREEGKQNLVFRMLTTETLHQGASLFKLTQRSRMEPHIMSLLVHLSAQNAECVDMSLDQKSRLSFERIGQQDKESVDVNG